MHHVKRVLGRSLVLLIASFTQTSTHATTDTSDDLLLTIPAIVAASGPTVEVCTAGDITGLRANSTALLRCTLNLQGESVSLPAGTRLTANGGSVSNGTLVFRGGRIDGDLLNSTLTVQGNPTLLDPVFNFYPERWRNIVQGPTNADTAFRNNQELERLFFLIKRLGGETFVMDRFDAFFEPRMTPPDRFVFRPSKEAVNLPSNFHLKMSPRTHLRVFPAQTEMRGGAILAVRDEENIRVSGGNLHGDRDTRFYSPNDNGLEGSHLFYIRSGRNVTLDGVRFRDGSLGAIAINSFGFSFNPTYNPTRNLRIQNCRFENIRRMAIALTDGRDVLIRKNTFINTGLPSSNSDGGEVGYAINIEPERTRDANGDLLEYQRVFDVLITENTERGSRGGFVTLTIGQDLTIENNDIGTRVVTSFVSGVKVNNNRFAAPPDGGDTFAIFIAGGQSETVFNNEVAFNRISGYASGIITSTRNVHVHDNTMTMVRSGIQIGKTKDSRFIDNVINSSSRGINSTNTYNNNVEVRGNRINATTGFHIYLANLNKGAGEAANTMTLSNNTTQGDRAVVVSNAIGVNLLGNQFEGGVEVGNVENVTVSNNTVVPGERDGIRLYGTHNSVTISGNQISEPTGAARFVCLNNNSETPSGLTLSANQCN